MSIYSETASLTVRHLKGMKQSSEKIACLTAYDAGFARLIDDAGIDVMLVGDSLGMVVQGRDSTLVVDMEAMIYHTSLVARARKRAFLIADMPFMSYSDENKALENAARLMREGEAQMVKLEAGQRQIQIVEALAQNGIPVCAHLGLMPQAIHKLGGYRREEQSEESARAMLERAAALVAAGADLLLLECVNADLAGRITQAVEVPVIGIGSGRACDGQILVLYDLLGITPKLPPFAKNYLADCRGIQDAVAAYVDEVKAARFPAA